MPEIRLSSIFIFKFRARRNFFYPIDGFHSDVIKL